MADPEEEPVMLPLQGKGDRVGMWLLDITKATGVVSMAFATAKEALDWTAIPWGPLPVP